MNKVLGAAMIVTGALVVYGGLTGRLPAMLAAIFKPADLGEPAGKPKSKNQKGLDILLFGPLGALGGLG